MIRRERRRLADDLAIFVRQYARKRRPGHDPNDRGYDRKLEARVRRMDPEALDALLRDADEADSDPAS